MKMHSKIGALIFAAVLCVSFAGCTAENGGSDSVNSTNGAGDGSSAGSSGGSVSAPGGDSGDSASEPADSAPDGNSSENSGGSNSTSSGVLADLTGTLDSVSSVFECSDGWTNGSMFNCTWRKSNVSFSDGSMKLKIDLDGDGSGKIPYSGAEFRSKDFYGYGMYEVVMKPIKNDGVVSSFFTYTGPSDKNPWDEIDIEFLGKDTTAVQFNYFTDGKGNHEYVYELGFDASEDFHTYGFDWQKDKITWYVDGKAVYTADKNIPSTPGKIMMNVWPGTGVNSWLKAFDGKTPLIAEYKSVDFSAKEDAV